MRLFYVLSGALVALAACGSTSPPDRPLDGTDWRLVSLESMSDEQGTTTVDEPEKYTVSFGTDGRAAFRVDCNRGSGSFEAAPADTDSGALTFGPIALTRMFCPQPSLDQDVARSLGQVRSYRIIDGRLHMSMLADSGILHWEPAGTSG